MKNIMQRTLRLFMVWGIGIFILIPQNQLGMKSPQEQLQFSDEDIKFFEEAQKKVVEYVDNLPTEASLRAQGYTDDQIKKTETKEKFDREVKRLSEMTEEQLAEEIEKALAEVASAQTPQAQPELPPTKIMQEDIVRPEPQKLPAVPSGKQQSTLELIDTIINSIDNFLRKAQIMVELPSKIPNWAKEGKMRGWPTTLTWNTFKTQIEELQTKLHKVKDRDPRTNNYKYLDDFIKDESLINNLTKVKDSLIKYEPKIELSSFGIDKMTSEARQATRTVLLSLHEAVSILGIPAALDKIIEKYEPTAKKIKESEESAQKRALEQSRMPRMPGSVSTSGIPASAREGYGPRYDFDRAAGYTPGHFEMPRTTPRDTDDTATKKLGGPGGTAGGASAKPAAEAPKKAEDVKKKAEEPKYQPDKTADRIQGNFENALETFKESYGNNENLNNLEKHIMKDTHSLVDEETVKAIRDATNALRKAISETTKMKRRLSNKDLNDNQKKAYKKALKEGFKEVKSDFEKIVTQINKFSKPDFEFYRKLLDSNRQPYDQPLEKIFKSKMYAYFGKDKEKDLHEFVEAEKKRTGAPLTGNAKYVEDILIKKTANLNSLKTQIQNLKKAIDDL